MSLRASAKYAFGLPFVRLMALNEDLSLPKATRLIGGVGPFDFTAGVDITGAAIPGYLKLDNGDVEDFTIDLSGAAAGPEAATVDEWVSAMIAGLAAATPAITGYTPSKESVTLRAKLVSATGTFLQFYGDAATLAMFGQGYGCKFLKADTMKSLQETPTVKADETITTTDAKGLDTEVISDGYRKGFSATLVDTARDPELRALLEGGVYDSTAKTYEAPTSASPKAYFFLEAYSAMYNEGTNKEANCVGYLKSLYRSCKGSVGQIQKQRGWSDGNYTIVGTSFTDETGVLYADVQETELTVAAFEALHVDTV